MNLCSTTVVESPRGVLVFPFKPSKIIARVTWQDFHVVSHSSHCVAIKYERDNFHNSTMQSSSSTHHRRRAIWKRCVIDSRNVYLRTLFQTKKRQPHKKSATALELCSLPSTVAIVYTLIPSSQSVSETEGNHCRPLLSHSSTLFSLLTKVHFFSYESFISFIWLSKNLQSNSNIQRNDKQ